MNIIEGKLLLEPNSSKIEIIQSELVIHSLSTAKNVILIDDVVTTGRTLLDHAMLLKRQFPKLNIYALCIAGG